jgi:hypothetical protein
MPSMSASITKKKHLQSVCASKAGEVAQSRFTLQVAKKLYGAMEPCSILSEVDSSR